MSPNPWATPEETAFLHSKMGLYITLRADGKLWRFWPALFKEWFDRFSEEVRQGLPAPSPDGDAPDLTPAQEELLGEAIRKMKGRLENWFRHHSKKVTSVAAVHRNAEDSLGNDLFQKKAPRQRPHRPSELFQKRNHEAIDAALAAAGFFQVNEASMVASLPNWADETDETHAARNKEAQAERMRIRTRVVDELFSQASEEELRSINELVDEETKKFALIGKGTKKALKAQAMYEAENTTAEPTPKEYQMAIDESPEVVARVHKAIAKRTGWYGITIMGGPNPRFGGGLSMKTVCFGRTQAGNDFEAAHGSFDDSISKKFQAFLKHSFPLGVRRSRALQEPEEDTPVPLPPLDDLFRLPNDAEPTMPVPRPKPRRVRKSKAKPKTKQAKTMPEEESHRVDAAIPSTTSTLAGPTSPASLPPSSSPVATSATAGSPNPYNEDLDLYGDGDDTFDTEAHVDSQWPAGMGPPSSPATAEAAASAERGGLHGATYMHPTIPTSPPIDLLLLNTASHGDTTPAIPGLHGVAWNRMPTSPTPTSNSLGFNFPLPSVFSPKPSLPGLFNRFHHIMGSTSAGRGAPVASDTVQPNAPMSSNSPARISRISSTAAGAAVPTPVTEGSSIPRTVAGEASAGEQTLITPAMIEGSSFQMRTRPMTKNPALAVTTKKGSTGAGKGRKAAAAGTGAKTAAKELAASEAAKGATKKSAAARRSAGAAAVASAEALVDTTNAASAGSTATPAEPPALITTITNNNATNARMARRLEGEKKARDTAARKERARLHNPDGPTDLVILPGPAPEVRTQRVRKPARNFDGSEVVVPAKKLTRAQQLAKQNEPTEDALLARTGRKRGAAEAMPAPSCTSKRSKK